MDDFPKLLSTANGRLSSAGFRVGSNVELSDGSTADLGASRTTFSWKGLVVISQHLLLRRASSCSVPELQAFFEAGFHYGKSANRVPLFRGLQFGYMIIPC